MITTVKSSLIGAFSLLLFSCTASETPLPLLNTEPEANSVVDRIYPPTLRLYFNQLPDVSRSEITLEGPNGPLNLRGLHTMGVNDLMIEINDEIDAGDYTVNWSTYLAEQSDGYQGAYSFTVSP